MRGAKTTAIACLLVTFLLLGAAAAQRDKEEDEGPTADLNFLVLKEDNGKPVRNAAVIMHPVNKSGKQGRGDLELKTDADGKANYDDLPYGRIRVQVLASGFQTFGEDYEIAQPKMAFTIRLKRPQKQYSIYDDHSSSGTQPKQAPNQNQQNPQNNKPN
jgi:hypothetical protein